MHCLKNVMLVEDDEDDQLFFSEALKKIEHAKLLSIASNGIEALEKIAHLPARPDIIFMDINMPVMDGITCLKELQKNKTTRDIPVIMLTTDNGTKELALSIGAKAFIHKPDSYRSLYEQLKHVLDIEFSVA